MPEKQNRKSGLLHGTYKTEYSKDGIATDKCGLFHNGVMLITGNRKKIRKHIMHVHFGKATF